MLATHGVRSVLLATQAQLNLLGPLGMKACAAAEHWGCVRDWSGACVQVRLNLHGVVSVENAQQIEEEEYEETVRKAPAGVDVKARCKFLL